MKVMMMILSLMVLVSCNGGGGSNNKNNNGGSGSNAYSEKQIDALNCNEDILGWAENAPMSEQDARDQIGNSPISLEDCGHFDIYIDEVLKEQPQAQFLKKLKKEYQDWMRNHSQDEDDSEEENDQDSDPDQWGDE